MCPGRCQAVTGCPEWLLNMLKQTTAQLTALRGTAFLRPLLPEIVRCPARSSVGRNGDLWLVVVLSICSATDSRQVRSGWCEAWWWGTSVLLMLAGSKEGILTGLTLVAPSWLVWLAAWKRKALQQQVFGDALHLQEWSSSVSFLVQVHMEPWDERATFA